MRGPQCQAGKKKVCCTDEDDIAEENHELRLAPPGPWHEHVRTGAKQGVGRPKTCSTLWMM
jgi:hypothetical protein